MLTKRPLFRRNKFRLKKRRWWSHESLPCRCGNPLSLAMHVRWSRRPSVRPVGRSADRIDRFDRSDNFSLVRKIDCVETIDFIKKSLKSEPPSRFFGRFKIFAIFGSVGSVFRSVRSILRPKAMVDRPGKDHLYFSMIFQTLNQNVWVFGLTLQLPFRTLKRFYF